MFLEEPHRTTRSYRAILERVGTKIFAPTDRLEPYYVAALALYRLEYLFRNQLLDSKFKPARFQIILALRLLVHSGGLPKMNSKEMERYCAPLMQILWDASRSEEEFTNAAKAVDAVAGGDFDSDALRTQPFTERLKAHIEKK